MQKRYAWKTAGADSAVAAARPEFVLKPSTRRRLRVAKLNRSMWRRGTPARLTLARQVRFARSRGHRVIAGRGRMPQWSVLPVAA